MRLARMAPAGHNTAEFNPEYPTSRAVGGTGIMLSLVGGRGDVLNRRAWMRIGAVGLGGLTLPDLLRLPRAAGATAGRAKSAILLFLSGGPAHQDMWDLKPDAPEAVRGTFRPI